MHCSVSCIFSINKLWKNVKQQSVESTKQNVGFAKNAIHENKMEVVLAIISQFFVTVIEA